MLVITTTPIAKNQTGTNIQKIIPAMNDGIIIFNILLKNTSLSLLSLQRSVYYMKNKLCLFIMLIMF